MNEVWAPLRSRRLRWARGAPPASRPLRAAAQFPQPRGAPGRQHPPRRLEKPAVWGTCLSGASLKSRGARHGIQTLRSAGRETSAGWRVPSPLWLCARGGKRVGEVMARRRRLGLAYLLLDRSFHLCPVRRSCSASFRVFVRGRGPQLAVTWCPEDRRARGLPPPSWTALPGVCVYIRLLQQQPLEKDGLPSLVYCSRNEGSVVRRTKQ